MGRRRAVQPEIEVLCFGWDEAQQRATDYIDTAYIGGALAKWWAEEITRRINDLQQPIEKKQFVLEQILLKAAQSAENPKNLQV